MPKEEVVTEVALVVVTEVASVVRDEEVSVVVKEEKEDLEIEVLQSALTVVLKVIDPTNVQNQEKKEQEVMVTEEKEEALVEEIEALLNASTVVLKVIDLLNAHNQDKKEDHLKMMDQDGLEDEEIYYYKLIVSSKPNYYKN